MMSGYALASDVSKSSSDMALTTKQIHFFFWSYCERNAPVSKYVECQYLYWSSKNYSTYDTAYGQHI